MDEAYKILPKEKHKYWDNFKKLRGEKVVNFVRSRLGEKENREQFSLIFSRLTRSKKRKVREGRKLYDYLKYNKWIK